MLKKIIALLCTTLLLLGSWNGPALTAGINGETNPFESIDQAREKVLTAMTAPRNGKQDVTLAAQTRKMQEATEELAARQPRYIVKFKNNVSLQEIYDGIKNYPFTVIGDSSMRMFTIETDNIDAVKSAFGDKIQFVEEDALVETNSITLDEYVGLQWALPAIKIPEAWARSKGSDDVVVAVIDSGWDPSHEDLISSEILAGYDYLLGGSVGWDSNGHGTSVTGIIAATPNNDIGIAGVNWDVGILPLLITRPDGTALISDSCNAIADAAATGVDVINMSFGGPNNDPARQDVIDYALSQGCILIAAAGNDGTAEYMYPASCDGVVSVGSINSSLAVSDFSQKNDAIDVVAPGEGVASTIDPYYNEGYLYGLVDGTSFAAPYVAGIAALVRALDGSIDSYDFQEILARTSTDKGPAGYDTAFGYGIVNAQAVVNAIAEVTRQYTINATANNGSYGSVTGSGDYFYGKSATVKAVPKAGYRFVRWLEYESTVSTSAAYTFTVTRLHLMKAEFAKIGTPTVKAVPASASSVKLTWAAVAGAKEYEIYRAGSSSGTYSKIGTTTSASYTNTGLSGSTTYYYKVRVKCVAGSTTTYGAYSTVVSTRITPATPAGVKAASAGYNSVKLTWGAAAGAAKYEVYRATSSTGTYTKLTETTSPTYTNTGLTAGKAYYYRVRAYQLIGSTKKYSGYSVAASAKPIPAAPASPKAASASYSSIKVSWGAVTGATKYEVYRATSGTGTYSKLTETTSASYTNTGLTTGKAYYYKVRAYRLVGSTKVYGSYTAAVSTKPVPAAPAGVTAARASASSIKVSWGAVGGATKYELYRATSKTGSYARVIETSSRSYTNTRLTTGKTYYYKVRAYRLVGRTKVYGGYGAVVSAKP